jgi:hypothetical protein
MLWSVQDWHKFCEQMIIMIKKIFLLCFFSAITVAAQTKEWDILNNQWTIETKYHFGFLMNHHSNMKVLNERLPRAYQISASMKTSGQKAWHEFFRYPTIGVSYILLDLGSPRYLGWANGLYPFMMFNLTNPQKIICLDMRLGSGLAHVQKPFHPTKNYKNAAIGTNLNVLFDISLHCKIKLFEPFYLSGGLAITHISNGLMKQPNSGLNYVTAFIGANYMINKHIPTDNNNSQTHNKNPKFLYTLYFSTGAKQYVVYDTKRYSVVGLAFEVAREHLQFTKISAAAEIFYDTSDYVQSIRKEEDIDRIQTLKYALAAGYSFHFGALSAKGQMGAYLHSKVKNVAPVYQRYSLTYQVGRLCPRLGFKAHGGRVDYIELAVGFRLNK